MIVAGLVGALVAAIVTGIALNFVTGEKQVQRTLEHRYAIDDPQFRRELGTLLGLPVIDGNRITNLENGIEIFPAMLQAVGAARHTINFETYIYWSGDIGREFAEALSERARAGVQVRVLIDWLGSQKMEQGLLDGMTEAGVHVERYHPLRWYQLARCTSATRGKYGGRTSCMRWGSAATPNSTRTAAAISACAGCRMKLSAASRTTRRSSVTASTP